MLKPVFSALADRIGPRLVLLGGLLGFAVASLTFVAAGNPGLLAAARLAQGMSAAAFSPAAGALVAIHGGSRRGGAFGSYGAAKSLGYLLGPVVVGAIVATRGYVVLFAMLAGVALVVSGAVVMGVPAAAPSPRHHETVFGLLQRLRDLKFLRPVAALAGVTGALSAGVGFLPVVGLESHLSAVVTGTCVSFLAASSIVAQLWAGRSLDRGRLPLRAGLVAGLGLTAAGFLVAAWQPGVFAVPGV